VDPPGTGSPGPGRVEARSSVGTFDVLRSNRRDLPFRLLYYHATDTPPRGAGDHTPVGKQRAFDQQPHQVSQVKSLIERDTFLPLGFRLSDPPAGFTVDFTDAPECLTPQYPEYAQREFHHAEPRQDHESHIDYDRPTPLASGSRADTRRL